MPIETLDDIVEELANQIDRYGAHEGEERESCRCRMCFTTGLADRIRRAVEVEQALTRVTVGPSLLKPATRPES